MVELGRWTTGPVLFIGDGQRSTRTALLHDGLPVYFQHKMKPYRVPQKDEKDPVMKAQLIEKLNKARDRRYIAPGKVDSLTSFFGVKE
jgi:hypothetical protein